jgi:MerR family copper efflux transcriptional regulator
MKISDLAKRVGMSTSAIRYYEANGLLPATQRGANRYRQYDDQSLQRLLVIKLAQRLGFSLEAVRAVLAAPTGMPHDLIGERLEQRLSEIETMEGMLRKQRDEILALKERLEIEWARNRCLTLNLADVMLPL